jgi:hypothetical protein
VCAEVDQYDASSMSLPGAQLGRRWADRRDPDSPAGRSRLARGGYTISAYARYLYRQRWASFRRVGQSHRMLRSPIVIGGCGRSGTTLLAAMLGHHSHIQLIPYESLALCPDGYRMHVPEPRPPDLRKLLGALHRLEIPPDKSRCCEKTPKNVQYFGAILDYLGRRVRIIHLVRDGRDVVLSMHPRSRSRSHVAPERWIDDVSAGSRFDAHPQVLTVRYEDLVTDPVAELHRIFDFVDEPFEPVHESYVEGRATSMEVEALGAVARRAPDPSSVGRWRERESDPHVQALQRSPVARALLDRYGYL